jgi:hypothetical protein
VSLGIGLIHCKIALSSQLVDKKYVLHMTLSRRATKWPNARDNALVEFERIHDQDEISMYESAVSQLIA